jgi:hypothetical protein
MKIITPPIDAIGCLCNFRKPSGTSNKFTNLENLSKKIIKIIFKINRIKKKSIFYQKNGSLKKKIT